MTFELFDDWVFPQVFEDIDLQSAVYAIAADCETAEELEEDLKIWLKKQYVKYANSPRWTALWDENDKPVRQAWEGVEYWMFSEVDYSEFVEDVLAMLPEEHNARLD